MSKSTIFITLIEATKSKSGGFLFQNCKKDPLLFFSKRNLQNEFNFLDDSEKEVFLEQEKFFDALVKYNFIDKSNEKFNLFPYCKICGKKTTLKSMYEGYKKTCCEQCERQLASNTYFNKTGFKNAKQNPEIKKMIKERYFEKTGYYHPWSNPEERKRKEERYFEKTGYYNPAQNPECVKKASETYFKRTGYTHQSKNPEVKKQKIEKSLKRYGTEYPLQNSEIKKNIIETCFKKYGVKNAKQTRILNIDKVDDIDFIITNFGQESLKTVEKQRVLEFFNISSSYYEKKLVPKLKEAGYKSKMKFDKSESEFIEFLNKDINTKLMRQYKIEGTRYKVDAYDPETNTVFEFLGDYWHGNPEVYDSEDINSNNGKTFKELYDDTFERLYEIKTLGYDVKYIWELDWIEKKLDGIKIL